MKRTEQRALTEKEQTQRTLLFCLVLPNENTSATVSHFSQLYKNMSLCFYGWQIHQSELIRVVNVSVTIGWVLVHNAVYRRLSCLCVSVFSFSFQARLDKQPHSNHSLKCLSLHLKYQIKIQVCVIAQVLHRRSFFFIISEVSMF